MLTKTLDFSLDIKSIDDAGVIQGYASTWTVDQGGDRVMPKAFIDGLVDAKRKGRRIPFLREHDPSKPVGIVNDLAEDTKGLFVEARILKDIDGYPRETYELLKAGALGGLSIGYRIPPGGMEPDPKNSSVMLLHKVDLREISLVTMPMNLEAKVVSVKSLFDGGVLPTVREFEHWLRDVAGCSKSLATAIASRAAPVLRGEPEAKAIEAVDFMAALSRALKVG